MKKLLLALLVLLAIPIVQAAVDVTYVFDQPKVNSTIYNCLDAGCNQVGPFSGSYQTGAYTENGKITIRYPDTLNPNGYGAFFVSNGYRPLEIKATWNTKGQPGLAPPKTINYQFTKKIETCRATVTALNFVNEVKPHVPVIIDTRAQLDAQTASAFQLVDNEVGYIPDAFKQEYYGADTIVKMEIIKAGQTIHTQSKDYTAKNGNAIIASTSTPVQFKYTPTETGDYTVKVTAQVVDNQCTTFSDTSSQGTFTALADEPSGQFYTILNQLTINNTYPKIGQTVLVTYNKITNHVTTTGTYTPVQTDVDYTITTGTTNVFTQTKTLFANPDNTTPVTYSFAFTPTTAGVHTISVKGKANSALPTTQTEIIDEETIQLTVSGQTSYDVTFYVTNAKNDKPIENATITIAGKTEKTNNKGKAILTAIPQGTQEYTIRAEGYGTKTDTTKVNSEQTINVVLYAGETEEEANRPPSIYLPDITISGQYTINYFNYVHDAQDSDNKLTLNATSGNTDISVAINKQTGIITFTPNTGFSGTNTITFTLNDTQNASVTDTMLVTVLASAQGPTFNTLPTIMMKEDNSAVKVINLRDYTNDTDTPADQIQYGVLSILPTIAKVQIHDKQYLSIYPNPDQNGTTTITLTISDGASTNSASLTLVIEGVNDAPTIIAKPKTIQTNESTSVDINLTKVFNDPDADALTFDVTPTQNVGFIINNALQNITLVPDFNVNGTRQFNVTATDPSGEEVTAEFTLNIGFIDDAPNFTQTIPNIQTFEETINSLDLTPFEDDPEEGPGANNNTLNWKMTFANQTNATPVTTLTNTLFTATINQTTDTLLITPNANQTGSENITLYLYDSTGKNASQNITITVIGVNDAPYFVNLTNQTAQAGIPFSYVANASDLEGDLINYSIANITPTLNGLTIDNTTANITITPATSGTFNVTVQACDTTNSCTNGTFTLTITDTTQPTPQNQITPPNPSTYAPNASYTFLINWTDNGQINNVTFEFDGINYTNTTNNTATEYQITLLDLAAGNHTYKWNAKDNANNTNSTNTSNFIINKANGATSLLLNNTASAITVPQGTNINITANITNTTGTVNILKDGVIIGTGTAPLTINHTFTTQGTFNITANFNGNTNYTGANTTLTVTVPDSIAPTFGAQTNTPTSPAKFTNSYNFKQVITDNVAVDTVTFELDNTTNTTATQIGNTTTYEANLTTLSVGNHTIKWYANDTTGNTNSTTFSTYAITKGDGAITLTINGFTTDTSVQVNDTATIIANLTNPTGGNVELYINGTLAQNSTSPLTNVTNFTTTGTIPIMAIFTGDSNATAVNITRMLTITPIIAQTNITPASGTSFNFNFFTLTLDTNGITTCKWSPSDVPQGSMNNSFTTTNGLNHTTTINGLVLGANTISVACNNQSASTNTDLTYTVNNILNGSTTSGTNSFTNSIILNSTITNITSTDSNITRSTLTNCTINNSTLIDITASNCSLSNGFYDPSDLTGSTISNSNVTNSNVTFSNVTNSDITNTAISNATITDAQIANGTITAGAITVGNTTYNATTSGTATLGSVIPVPPSTGFTISGSTTPGTTLTFTSTTTDANIGGPLNDTLTTFFWNFGDGTNATTQNTTHSYSAGTFTITYTVTDSFGLQSTATQTVTIATPPAPSSGSSGGGGGGSGGGGSAPKISLTNIAIQKTVSIGQPLLFSKDGKQFPLSIVLRRIDTAKQTTEWILNGQYTTIAKAQSAQFDLSKDGIADVEIQVIDLGRTGITINAKLAGAVSPTTGATPLPSFNFPPKTEQKTPTVPIVTTPEVGNIDQTIPVQAEIGSNMFTKISDAIKNYISTKITPSSPIVKGAIVIAVVLIGLIGYTFYNRWKTYE